MTSMERAGYQQVRPERARDARPAWRRVWQSLYAQVVLANAAILLVALLVLLWTPVTVPARVPGRQAALLIVVLMVMVTANALLVKLSFRGLTTLTRRMRTLDILRRTEPLPELGNAETRSLINGFNTMQHRLEAERVASTRRNIRRLEDERHRISRELHDEIGQRATGILLQLRLLDDEVPNAARARVARVEDEARAMIAEIDTLAWQLRPGMLDELGLLSAMKALTASIATNAEIHLQAILPPALPPLPAETELAIYRIAQEALTNVVRHSGGSTATVAMWVNSDRVLLQITDDGCGYRGADQEGAGLRGMRERALLIGGRLSMKNVTPHGSRVELMVPDARLGS